MLTAWGGFATPRAGLRGALGRTERCGGLATPCTGARRVLLLAPRLVFAGARRFAAARLAGARLAFATVRFFLAAKRRAGFALRVALAFVLAAFFTRVFLRIAISDPRCCEGQKKSGARVTYCRSFHASSLR